MVLATLVLQIRARDSIFVLSNSTVASTSASYFGRSETVLSETVQLYPKSLLFLLFAQISKHISSSEKRRVHFFDREIGRGRGSAVYESSRDLRCTRWGHATIMKDNGSLRRRSHEGTAARTCLRERSAALFVTAYLERARESEN